MVSNEYVLTVFVKVGLEVGISFVLNFEVHYVFLRDLSGSERRRHSFLESRLHFSPSYSLLLSKRSLLLAVLYPL